MFVCKECFADDELRAYIDSNSTNIRECDICHINGKTIELSELYDFFDDLLSLFEPNDNGRHVSSIIQTEWNLFKDEKTAKILLEVILSQMTDGFQIDSLVDYKEEIKVRVSIWEKLKKNVKENRRFFTSVDDFAVYNYIEPTSGLTTGTKLYRSRITPQGTAVLSCEDMGCPPKEKAIAGRSNPIGIPYLYLCDTAKTTYYEVRALYLDKLSVGVFEIQRNLKIVDFVYNINLFLVHNDSDKSLKEVVIKKKVIDAISADLSKPMRRYDSELEYVPTQLICEYCRDFADGICFESSLYKGGRNYVLFDSADAKCIQVESHEITKIEIDKD